MNTFQVVFITGLLGVLANSTSPINEVEAFNQYYANEIRAELHNEIFAEDALKAQREAMLLNEFNKLQANGSLNQTLANVQ